MGDIMKKFCTLLVALVICLGMAGIAAAEGEDFETAGAYEGPYFVKRVAASSTAWKAVFTNGLELNSIRQGSNSCSILSVAQALQAPVWIQRNSYGHIEAVSMGEAP